MRYLVFGFDTYYPSGGIRDLIGTFPEYHQAAEYAGTRAMEFDHMQIYDAEKGELVSSINGRIINLEEWP